MLYVLELIALGMRVVETRPQAIFTGLAQPCCTVNNNINVYSQSAEMHNTQFEQPNLFLSVHDKTIIATKMEIESNKF